MSESENEIKSHSTRLPSNIYRRRQTLAGLGVVAILMAVILTIQALTSDTGQVSGSQGSEQVENTHNQSATDVVVPRLIGAASTTTTLVIDGPPRVSIYGDSLADGFGGILKSTLDRQGVTTFLATKGSSGLSQPRFFDWPNHLNVWVSQENADVVVIGLGANDGQDVFVNDVSYSTNDPEWAAQAQGVDVVYVDTWSLFLGLDGNYSQYVIDPSDGERKKSRDGDGFHLSLVGNKMLAAAITAEVDAAFERRAAR